MRRFYLDTIESVHPGSTEGELVSIHRPVAAGVVFYDGTVAVRWLGDKPSTILHASFEAFAAVHYVIPKTEHEVGKRHVRWYDPICFRCGVTLDRGQWSCDACGAIDRDGHYEDEPDPSRGEWRPALLIAPQQIKPEGEAPR